MDAKSATLSDESENAGEASLAETAQLSFNSVDTTLEDIRKLRVIDKELASANFGGHEEFSGKKDKIDEKEIEENTLNAIKTKGRSKKDLESMVQDQIQDQANQIEDSQTLQQSFDILEYGVTLDTSDYKGQDSPDKDVRELQEKEAAEKRKKEEKAKKELD